MKKNIVIVFLTFLILSLGLASCGSQESTVTANIDCWIYDTGEWQVELNLSYQDVSQILRKAFKEIITLFGGPQSGALAGKLPTGNLKVGDKVMRTVAAYYGTKEIAAEWQGGKKAFSNRVNYTLKLSGRDWESMESLLPEEKIKVVEIDENQLQIEVSIGDLNPAFAAVFDENIIVHVDQVIDSNAPFQEKNSARWLNPQKMEIIFKPKSCFLGSMCIGSMPTLINPVSLIVFGGVIVVIAVLVWVKVRKNPLDIRDDLNNLG